MSLTQENLKAFIERETISDFINIIDYVKVKEDSEFGIYNCRNGYRAFALEVFPSFFAGLNEHETILSLLGFDYPVETAIDILFLPSRNIDREVETYREGHSHPKKIKNPEALQMIIDKNAEWLISHRDESLVNSPIIDVRPKNYRTLIFVQIPLVRKDNQRITDKQVIRFGNITKGRLKTLEARFIENDDFLSVFNELINPLKKDGWDITYDKNTPIYNHFLSSEDKITEENELITFSSSGTNPIYASVLSSKKFPSSTNVASLQNMFFDLTGKSPKNHFSAPHYIMLRVIVEDKEKAKNFYLAKSRMNKQTLEQLGQKLISFFPSVAELAEESQALVTSLDAKGQSVFKCKWSLVMFEKEESELHEKIEIIRAAFDKTDWTLQVETELSLIMFLDSLPMKYDPIVKKKSGRYNTVLDGNNGALAPLYKDCGSFGRPDKSMMLFGRQGQLLWFDNFEKGRPGNNMVVAAGTRSGKSFMITNKIIQDIACSRKVTFIELDETLVEVIETLGGEYIRFDEKSERKCLNFFTDIKIDSSGEIDPESLFLIVPLVGLMINWELDSDESSVRSPDNAVMASFVIKAIKASFHEAGHEAGMAEVYTNMDLIYKEIKEAGHDDNRLRDAVISLEPYAIRSGIYYEYFNGKRNIYFNSSNLVGIGLAALKEKGELFSIVLMALTQAIINEYFSKKNQLIEKVLYIDEAWALLENPIFVQFLIKVWRTLNKYNGAGVAISQDIDQYFKTKELEAMYNNSTYKIFFQQPEDVVERLMKDKKLPDDHVLKRTIVSLKTVTGLYSEMMIYTSSGFSVNRVISNKFLFYLITNADNGPEVFKLMSDLNIEKKDAAEILSYKDEKKCTIQQSADIYYYNRGKIRIEDLSEDSLAVLQNKKKNITMENDDEDEESIFELLKKVLKKFLKDFVD